LFVGAVALLEHDAEEVVGLCVLLVLGDDLPAEAVEVGELVDGAAAGVVEHHLHVHDAAFDVALLGCPPDEVLGLLGVVKDSNLKGF
jgi:hypothetical protein